MDLGFFADVIPLVQRSEKEKTEDGGSGYGLIVGLPLKSIPLQHPLFGETLSGIGPNEDNHFQSLHLSMQNLDSKK